METNESVKTGAVVDNGKTTPLDLTTEPTADDLPVAGPPAVVQPATDTRDTGRVTVQFDQARNIPAHLTGPIRWDHPQAAHVRIIDREKGLIERTRSKVCIVGYAEVSRHLAWYEDPDCEIWGVNQLYRFIPRADRWFQIHRDWNDKDKWAAETDQAEWLKACPIPVYMISADPEIPNSVAYPVDRVMAVLDVHDYFTSSIAFMVALAIAEGFTDIGIYGIDLIIGREYQFEKACVEFYLGIAHARGLNVHRPQGCALLWQSHRYGWEQEPDYGFYGLNKLAARKQQLEGQTLMARDKCHVWQGRIDEATFIRERLSPEGKAEMDKRIEWLRIQHDKSMNKLCVIDGAHQEISRMHQILDTRSRGGMVE